MRAVNAVVVLLVLCATAFAQEHNAFSAEESPRAIDRKTFKLLLPTLSKDPIVAESTQREIVSEAELREWFSGFPVTLGKKGETGLVVIGRGPLLGAHGTSFWVFLHHGGKYCLVLPTRCDGIVATDTYTNGLRDFVAAWLTASTVSKTTYKFKDGKYQPAQ